MKYLLWKFFDFKKIISPGKDKIDIKETEITLVPKNSVHTDLDTSLKLYKLLETLEDLDDTQNVYSNAAFPDEMVNHLD